LLLCVVQRQFPRASGYPEDPATGIAAAALAVSLYASATQTEEEHLMYKIHQGSAMNKPSLIMVENIELDDKTDEIEESKRTNFSRRGNVSFSMFGRVEIDDRETIDMDEDSKD